MGGATLLRGGDKNVSKSSQLNQRTGIQGKGKLKCSRGSLKQNEERRENGHRAEESQEGAGGREG